MVRRFELNCWVYAMPNVVLSTFSNTSGGSSVTINVPLALNLLGVNLYNQWLMIDLGTNPLPIVTSNGGKAIIGF